MLQNLKKIWINLLQKKNMIHEQVLPLQLTRINNLVLSHCCDKHNHQT